LLILGLAACFGAGLARQRANEAPSPSQRRQKPAEGPRMLPPIDQEEIEHLQPVRAPADLGERAFEKLRTIVGFGPRHTAATPTPGWSQQLDYIENELLAAGLKPTRDTWTDRKELLTFSNVSAVIPGRSKDRIVLACHHDTKCTQGHADPKNNFHFVGANDGGSAVALLLALAPTLAARQGEATVELLFLDGEESLDWRWNDGSRAMFGSKRYVQRHRDGLEQPQEPPIRALVLLDMVARTDLHIQEELYSDERLRKIAFAAAVATGRQRSFFQASESASDDHIPFLLAGIPSIDLIDLKGNPHWHEPTDTIDNCSAASMQAVADVVLTMLPAVERAFVGAAR
jgi:glutaminyl-peptide cyclotransferase